MILKIGENCREEKGANNKSPVKIQWGNQNIIGFIKSFDK